MSEDGFLAFYNQVLKPEFIQLQEENQRLLTDAASHEYLERTWKDEQAQLVHALTLFVDLLGLELVFLISEYAETADPLDEKAETLAGKTRTLHKLLVDMGFEIRMLDAAGRAMHGPPLAYEELTALHGITPFDKDMEAQMRREHEAWAKIHDRIKAKFHVAP